MNKHTSMSRTRTLSIGGLIALSMLAAVALLLLAWPNAMASAGTSADPADPTLSPDGPLPDVPIVFVSRNRLETLDNIHVGPPLDVPGRERTPGGRLLVWRPDGSVTDLTAGTSLYDVQQPDVSFAGTKVVFSAVTGRGEQWHLYEIGLDGTGLRQLTFDDRDIPIPDDPRDPGRNELVFGRYGDFGPAYLPDGRIIFVSTRYMTLSGSCGHRGQNLYVLDPETGEMFRRTTEKAGAIDPAVLSDGTVVFSHWIDAMNEPATDGPGLRPLETDYNFAPSFWGIWAMNPDGTGAHRYAFLRGGLQDGGGAYQPHELPDGDPSTGSGQSLVVTFRGAGSLLGNTLANAITRIEPGLVEPHELRFLGDPYNLEGPHALGPAPLSDGRIVCSYTPTSTVEIDWRGRHTASYDFGLYVVDEEMKTLTPLYNEPDTDELDAVAVYPRSAPIIPDCPNADLITDDPTIELGTTATMINHNVYADLALNVVDLPSPKVGTVAWVHVYDDSQTFTTSDEFPLLRKQMPRLVGSFPVDENGAFTATVPADKALLFVLVNENGVAVRSPMSLVRPNGLGNSLTHTFNGHDYLRPDDVIQCSGCHKGHMMKPDLAVEAQANLSRLAVATASSEPRPFFAGAWRANDVRLAEEDGRYSWATAEGPGAWLQLDWPMEIEATQAVLYPLTAHGCHVTAATLTLSDGTSYHIGPLPEDGSALVIPFDPPSTISWIRFTVDAADPTAVSDVASRRALVGLAELVVNGPPDVALPDTPPPAPTNLTITDGVLFLQWDRVADPGLAGYKLYYGTEPGQYVGSVDVGDVSWFLARDLPQDGVTYYVAAKAYNVYGTESLIFSNEVSATAHAPVVTGIEPDHGPIGGGTAITIIGQYFAPRGVRVSLGGHHAYGVQVVDEHTITAFTHWHVAGTVDVVVSNPDDLFGILPDGFTYQKPEPPTVTDIRVPGG